MRKSIDKMQQSVKPGYKPSLPYHFPSGWTVKPLGEIGEFSKGKGILKEQVISDGLPCIRYGELYTSYNYLISKCRSFISNEVASDSQEIKYGDILFAGSGETIEEIGKSAAYIGCENAYAGGDLIILSPNIEINSECLSYALETDFVRKQKRRYGQGQQVVHIYPSDLAYVKVALPPLPEQQKIASILSTWDEAISKTQQLIKQLKERNRGLQQQLLTGKKRITGFEKAKWVKGSADTIFRSVSTKNNFGDEQLLSVTQDRGAIPRDMLEGRVTMPSGDTNAFKLVEPGDFIISLRSFQGGLEYSEYRGLVSPAYTVLKPIGQIDNDFYKFYFKSYDFIGHLAIAVIGIRDGKQISFDDFCTVRLPNPPVEEQRKIAEVLRSADMEVKVQEQKFNALKQQKKGLMQKLLTGEIRVNANK